MGPSISFFDVLSTELVSQILELLNDASPKSLFNVALASRRLHAVSNPILHRCLVISISPRATWVVGNLIKHLHEDSDLCTTVRQIIIPYITRTKRTVSRIPERYGLTQRNEQWRRLIHVLPLLCRLNKITYTAESPVPRMLLDYLRRNSQICQLWVSIPFLSSSSHTRASVTRLQHSSSLFALDLCVRDLSTIDKLKEVVSSCPTLRQLSVTTAKWNTNPSADFLWGAVESPRSLQSLRILGIDHDEEDFGWIKYANWSSLTRLSVSFLNFIPHLAPLLVNLESFKVDLGFISDPEERKNQLLNKFLYECKPLRELELIGYTNTFDLNILHAHGQTLRELRFRENYSGREDFERTEDRLRPVLSIKDIQRIGERCPNLVALGIDLPHQEADNGTWPYEFFDAIVEYIWFLRHVDLYVDIGKDVPYKLAVTVYSVRGIWKYMWDKLQVSSSKRFGPWTPPRLRALDVYNEFTHSLPPYAVSPLNLFMCGYSEIFRARLSGRDNEARRGIVKVTNDRVETISKKMRQELGSMSLEKDFKAALWKAENGASKALKPYLDELYWHKIFS